MNANQGLNALITFEIKSGGKWLPIKNTPTCNKTLFIERFYLITVQLIFRFQKI